MEKKRYKMSSTWLGTSKMEQEANYFAMCLLMPEEMLVPDWEASSKDSDAVDELARAYHVTRNIMAGRLFSLGLYKQDK